MPHIARENASSEAEAKKLTSRRRRRGKSLWRCQEKKKRRITILTSCMRVMGLRVQPHKTIFPFYLAKQPSAADNSIKYVGLTALYLFAFSFRNAPRAQQQIPHTQGDRHGIEFGYTVRVNPAG
jgi:hypothetical protein